MSCFFHTLVVFGAGAALSHCGGKTASNVQDDGDLEPDASDSADGAAMTGGAPGAPTSTGGVGGTGGLFHSDGGTTATDPRPIPGVENVKQWDCSGQFEGCNTTNGRSYRPFALSAACPLDETRPKRPEDCESGERFQCYHAVLRETDLLVNCHCAPKALDGTCSSCTPIEDDWHETNVVVCAPEMQICACAYTGIVR